MAIETLADWNDRITNYNIEGCNECCPIEGQDGFAVIGESINGLISVEGWSDSGNLYLIKTISYSDGGSSVQTYDSPYGVTLGGDVIVPVNITTVNTPPLTGTATTTYSSLIDVDAAFLDGRNAADTALDWATMDISEGLGSAYYSTESTLLRSISYNRNKFRKADTLISTQIGNYIKFTFDIVDYYEDDTDNLIFDDETLEWTGTFDIDDQTNSAHYTDWYYINPPTSLGQRDIKNVRYTKYQNTRYGNKPQADDFFGTYP